MSSCVDTPDWDNHSGKRCSDYALQEWCVRGAFKRGHEWTGGAQFNYPETNCCICGKPSAAGAYPWTQAAAAAVAPRLVEGRDVFGRPLAQTSAMPSASAAAEIAVMASDVEKANEEDEAELARDERLRPLVKQRAASCAALAPNSADNFLLVSPRLPRVGNGLLCAVLSACSQRPLACAHGAGGAGDQTMCPGGADWRYNDLGPAKLHKEAYGCFQRLQLPVGSSAGWDKMIADCSTQDGDVGSMCELMRSSALPAALTLQHEHFFEPQAAPCSWEAAPVRYLTLLRDPGERAQSAYDFGLSGCICAFKFKWCTMFTSFRFNTRRAALCDGARPRYSFHEAVNLLKETGVREWPVATDNPMFVLGRYATAVIRNVYTPYFGAATEPTAADADAAAAAAAAAAPAAPLVSATLARATLSHCFAWVGIAEEMALSLQLLRHELPQFFRNLDPTHAAFKWRPASDRGGRDATGNASVSHPFLRAHVLGDDYRLYDTERARLFSRASKLGLMSRAEVGRV